MSSHGEVFDIYVYSTKNALINKDFPEIIQWENKKVTDTTVIGKWRNCPIDSQTKTLYEPIFGVENFKNGKECISSFNKEMINPKNYYCYVYFSEKEGYFLLYCTYRQELYYVRLIGILITKVISWTVSGVSISSLPITITGLIPSFAYVIEAISKRYANGSHLKLMAKMAYFHAHEFGHTVIYCACLFSFTTGHCILYFPPFQ
jgi:hypothetical protein